MLPIIDKPDRVYWNNLASKGSAYLQSKKRTAQKKPYNLPTNYWRQDVRTTEAWARNTFSNPAGFNALMGENGGYMPGPNPSNLIGYDYGVTWAVNTAREALVAQLNEEAMLAVNFAERAQTINMMSKRLGQLTRFTRWLRRGNVVRAAQELQVAVPRTLKNVSRRRVLKKFGDTWLEFHFGWEPLVKDIYNACDLIQKPIAGGQVTVRGRTQQIGASFQNAGGCSDSKKSFRSGSFSGRVRGKAGMSFAISNPNLYLANRLGLVNPAAVAWELVPYSFVVDWFVNCSQVIGEFSDFIGVKVENAWYGTTCKAIGSYYDAGYIYCDTKQPYAMYFYQKEGLYSYRYLGLPSVKLGIKPFKRLSTVRAATAISLLLQHLK